MTTELSGWPLFEDLQPNDLQSHHTLVVGIGAPHGDDQCGWLVVDCLARELDNRDAQLRRAASPADLLNWMSEVRRLIVCDCCQGLGQVGQLRRWVWPSEQLEDVAWSGTHDLSLPTVLRLAQRLGQLPPCVVIWALEGAATEALKPVSPLVAAALPRLVDLVAREVLQATSCTNNH